MKLRQYISVIMENLWPAIGIHLCGACNTKLDLTPFSKHMQHMKQLQK